MYILIYYIIQHSIIILIIYIYTNINLNKMAVPKKKRSKRNNKIRRFALIKKLNILKITNFKIYLNKTTKNIVI